MPFDQILQDIFAKKHELICPECRQPVAAPISSLPPNILANRILEGMSQTTRSAPAPAPAPALASSSTAPALPAPKKPTVLPSRSNPHKKPPAPAPNKDVYQNVTPVHKPMAPTPVAPGPAPIPGNHSTNPFLDLIDASPYYDKQRAELSPALSSLSLSPQKKTGSVINVLTTTNDQTLIQSLAVPSLPAPRPPAEPSTARPARPAPPAAGPPAVPARPPATSALERDKLWQLSPRALLSPPSRPPGSLQRATHDYTARQADELSLSRGELYFVTEQCGDGWCRGKSLKSGKTGVFPGNHVQEHDKQVERGIDSNKR